MTRAGTAERPRIFGILNVTPDSFSDGGNFFSVRDAVARAMQLLADGADVIDVGGESTRPGASAVPAEEEMRRVIPVISEIASSAHARISIDTVKAEVARAALDAGATMINDVSGMRLDPDMATLAAESKCEVILMHSRGSVAEMATYDFATYGNDPVGEILGELTTRVHAVEKLGVNRSCITIDPGIGFSKRSEHSALVLKEIHRFVETGYPVCLGVSRKRVVAEMVARESGTARDPKSVSNDERDRKTVELNVAAFKSGVTSFRVHDVKANRAALDAAWIAAKDQ
ncbi:MAG: dihydropteroate synthase [Gemmatimonadaceae bacterium]|nr:dihydropteroate synthase [Gemmatimonadaceae bacterium]